MKALEKIYEEVEFMKSMMKSVFVYDSVLSKQNSYLIKYKKTLGEELYNDVFDEDKEYLTKNYSVVEGTYTDCEGVTYNSLVKI